MNRLLLFTCITFAMTSAAHAQRERLSSDFELQKAAAEAKSGRPFDRIAAQLNLGDIYRSRSEPAAARSAYRKAKQEADAERLRSRAASEIATYGRATSYSGLAAAKLGRIAESIELFEESTRYLVDSAGNWNLYASAMLAAGEFGKSVGAARMAVALGERDLAAEESVAKRLDLNVYRYTFASAAAEWKSANASEAVALLDRIIGDLTSPRFQTLRDEIARNEEFELLGSVRTDSAAYNALLARSRLRLASLHEREGRAELARQQYAAVLDQRNDDPSALAGLARLAAATERADYFDDAFVANPFSWPLIREYEAYLRSRPSERSSATTGVQRAVELIVSGDLAAAEHAVAALAERHPRNDTIRALRARVAFARGERNLGRRLASEIADTRIAADLRSMENVEEQARVTARRMLARGHVIAATDEELRAVVRVLRTGELTPAERQSLDAKTFNSRALVDFTPSGANSVALAGRIGSLPVRFPAPTEFRGRFEPDTPLMLTFRILGPTMHEGSETLLVEPLEVKR